MQIGKIVSTLGNKFNTKNSNSKQDLTSFGVASNQNMLSKNSTQALKNKYGANVSFDGHHKTVQVKETGKEVIKSAKYYYGSGACVWYTTDTYEGEYDGDAQLIRAEEDKEWQTDKYSAKMDGAKRFSDDTSSMKNAVEKAIKSSSDFIPGSTIIETRKPNTYYSHKGTADVYFSDKYETISRTVIDDKSVNYIVKAPDADIEEPPKPAPRKKSWFERIFG